MAPVLVIARKPYSLIRVVAKLARLERQNHGKMNNNPKALRKNAISKG
jgi:hypothetical protein